MSLEQLIDSGQVWRFEQSASSPVPSSVDESAAGYAADKASLDDSEPDAAAYRLSSGFSELDAALAEGGWPLAGVTEILYPAHGMGELSLLLPALRTLSEGQRWIVWIAPPFQLNSIALAAEGVNIHNHIVLSPDSNRDFWWACEEVAKSGACSALLAWPDTRQISQQHYTCVRRLQIAAAQHRVACFLYQHQQSSAVSRGAVSQGAAQATPSALRLQLSLPRHENAEHSVRPPPALLANILKQRGPRTERQLALPIARPDRFHYSQLSNLKHLLQTAQNGHLQTPSR